MKVDNTPTVTRRTRPISRKLRLRLETAQLLKKHNQRSKSVRQKRKDAKTNAKVPDPEKHTDVSRVPRVKKNKLAVPPKATSKYKKRQVNKTWLPTHLWHTKRARMTRPTEPLWRMAIPLAPTEKSYRPSHRASTARGCIAWDASYMSTVGCLGTDHTLENMLKLLGFVFDGKASLQRKWHAGTRHAQGWIHEIDNGKKPIVPATVVWMAKPPMQGQTTNSPAEPMNAEQPDGGTVTADASASRRKKVKLDRMLFIRVHPSSFQQFWLELLRAAKMQKPQVLVEDLRFEIGSIEITGPGSTEALIGILQPRHPVDDGAVGAIWTSLAGISNPASLPDRALLAFDIVDPRLGRPPKKLKMPPDQGEFDKLNELTTSWPIDHIQTTPQLSSYKARWLASTNILSPRAINRRRAEAGKGRPISVIEKNPAIPIILLANRLQTHDASAYGSWTVMLPWCCVDAVWRPLMHYSLSSGQTPRFGGLDQLQQITFEHMTPWYPGDFPGTEAGMAWERTESEKRFDAWLRRPPSRRIRWDLVELGLGRRGELGRGWTCDWEYMLADTDKSQNEPAAQATEVKGALDKAVGKPGADRSKSNTQKKNDIKSKAPAQPDRRRNTSSPESDTDPGPRKETVEPALSFSQLTPSQASATFRSALSSSLPSKPVIATVRLRLLTKGTPSPAARIYRLPLPTSPLESSEPPSNVAQSSTHPADSDRTPSNDSAPPPGQPSPPTPATSAGQSSASSFANLRTKWLSLLSPHLPLSYHASLPKHSKQKQNHRGLAPKHVVHSYDPPDHINVLPRNAPQSIIDEFGRKPLTVEQLQEQQRKALMEELMKNEIGSEEKWDASKGLVECPNPEDLIGYVTSGAFNLSEGIGTAVGGLWVQRVIEGWRAGYSIPDSNADARSSAPRNGSAGTTHRARNAPIPYSNARSTTTAVLKRGSEQEKYLCVIRNAGESVGRLGIWELCE